MIRIAIWTLALVGIVAIPTSATTQDAEFEEYLAKQVEAIGVPGAVVGVFKDGEIVYHRAFGLADIADGTKMERDMAFEIGSVSKQFVAVALLTFVEEGKIALDDTLGKVLPSAPEEWHAVTVEQLLRHISGVPDYEAIAGYDFYNKEREPKEIFDQALKRALDFPAGEKFSYSNTGYVLLSLIVERAASKPIGEVLEERLFDPAGMSSTYATRKTDAIPATGYHSRSGTRTAQPPIAWSSTLAAGGIVSTIKDMQKWDESLYTEKILTRVTLQKVWSTGKLNDGSDFSYGFGWNVGSVRGVYRQQHSGQTNGFTCVFMRFPEHRYSVVMWTNTYGGRIGGIAREAAVHFLPQLSYNGLPIPTDTEPLRTALHLRALRQAVLAEGDLGLLRDGMREFATVDRYKPLRDSIFAPVDSTKSFEFIRITTSTADTGNNIDQFLYKQTYVGGTFFWTMTFVEGKLSALNWERE